MFHYSEESGAYLAELNGAEFICEAPSAEDEERARALADCYESRLPALAEFMLEELDGVYGPMTVSEFIRGLGRPQFDLDRSAVAFLEHDFDDHILEVEYEGGLEEFLVLTMDG